MTARYPTSGVIIAGGRSRRLGSDKRELRLWGNSGPTLLRHTVDLVAALCDEVIVVLNDPERWPDLPARIVGDAYPDSGALGGLASGLAAAQHPYALVVASDMPLLSSTLLAAMLALTRDYDALVPQVAEQPADSSQQPADNSQQPADNSQQPAASEPQVIHQELHEGRRRTRNQLSVEPLHAIYSRACLAAIEERIAAGRFQIIGFFKALRVSYLDPALIARHDPAAHSFLSVNTPEQLAFVQGLIAELK